MVDLTDASANGTRPELEHINALVDAGQVAWRAASEKPRSYLGGSRLGEECERRLAYEWHGTPEDEGKGFSGKTLRVFERGHHAEERMAGYLHNAGFQLQTEKAGGGQFGFYVAKDPETGQARIAGHADGIVTGYRLLPEGSDGWPGTTLACAWQMSLPFPMLWEHKGLKAASFRDLKKKGLKKSKPIYYAQVNIYMAYMDLKHAFFTAECQDTCEVYVEVVPFDLRLAQEANDKGVRVVSSRAPEDLPRVAAKDDDFRCKFCPFAGRCWSAPQGGGVKAIPVRAGWLQRPD